MAPIKLMPALDFRFGHSFAYFQYCAFITIEISAILGGANFVRFFRKMDKRWPDTSLFENVIWSEKLYLSNL